MGQDLAGLLDAGDPQTTARAVVRCKVWAFIAFVAVSSVLGFFGRQVRSCSQCQSTIQLSLGKAAHSQEIS